MSNQADDDHFEFVPDKEKTAVNPLLESISPNSLAFSPTQGNDQIFEETTPFLPESVLVDSLFQIHYSMLMDSEPVILVLHCSGDIVGDNCLILENAFKMCAAKNFPFVIVEMTNVLSVEKNVWTYLSSKVSSIQKLNGILIFAGINPGVLGETTDFHKLNICHCQTVELSCKVIRNLITEHEKDTCIVEQNEIKQSTEVIEFLDSNDSIIIDKFTKFEEEHVNIDESMSTSFSIIKEEPITGPIDIDDSMSMDFFTPVEEYISLDDLFDTAFLVKSEIPSVPDHSMNAVFPKNVTAPKMQGEDIPIDNKTSSSTEISPNVPADNTIIPDHGQNSNPNERSFPDMIHFIISQFGPCSFGTIKKKLHSDFGSVKISSINLYLVLKSMNLESMQKRSRYYRSC